LGGHGRTEPSDVSVIFITDAGRSFFNLLIALSLKTNDLTFDRVNIRFHALILARYARANNLAKSTHAKIVLIPYSVTIFLMNTSLMPLCH
jgi:hypothetical protein